MKTVGEANVQVSYQNQDPKSYGGARQWSCTTGQKLATNILFQIGQDGDSREGCPSTTTVCIFQFVQ